MGHHWRVKLCAFYIVFFVAAGKGAVVFGQNQEIKENKPVFYLAAAEHLQFIADNFFNKDLKLTGSARYSDQEAYLRLGLEKEKIGGSFFAGMDTFVGWEEDDRYHLQTTGEDGYIGKQLTEKIKATLKFTHEDLRMTKLSATAPQPLQEVSGGDQVNTLSLLLERSTLNNKYYPTGGAYHSLEWDCSAKSLESDFNFNRLSWQSRGYVTPGKFFTFMARTKVGWEGPFGSSDSVPFFDRFFCGGTSTIRGYRGRRVGPEDNDNLPLGGDLFWVNNAEVRFPLWKDLAGAYFIDCGNVWPKPGNFRFDDLKYGTGAGLRYITKWGVARLDYGLRLSHVSGQAGSRIHLTFGLPF